MKCRKLLTFLPMLVLALTACTRDPKVKAQRFVENGNKFFNRGDYKDASIMYRNALKQNGRFGEAYYRLALTDMKLSAYGDAFRAFLNTAELQPSNIDAKNQLARLYILSSLQSTNAQRGVEALDKAKELAGKILELDPHSFEGHLLMGQLALMKKDVPSAIAELQAANQSKPLQPDAVMPYVQALAANNRFPEAEKLAYQLIEKDHTYAGIYDVLYGEYLRENRLDDAERVLKLKTSNNPKNAQYLLQLAAFYIAAKRRDAAETVFKSMTDEKEHPDGHLLAGDFFFSRMHEYDRARAEYEAAIKALPKDKILYQKRLVELDAKAGDNTSANQLLAEILKENPKDADAIEMRASLMLTSGNRDQINMAVNDLQALVTKTPDNYVLRFNLARALRAKGENEQAILQLEEAVKLRPDFMQARDALAALYLWHGDSAKALKAADEIIQHDNNDVQGHLVKSGALLTVGERDQARKELDLIVKTFPQNIEARFQVGYLDYLEKDYKSASEVFSKLYQEYPKDRRGLVGTVETMVAMGRMPDAIAEVNRAIQSDPGRHDLMLVLANLYVVDKKYDQAIPIYQELLASDPKNEPLLYRIAETYRRKGDMNTAAAKFLLASQAAPSNPDPLLARALIITGTDRPEQAQPIYEQILKLSPDNPVALNNLAFIKAEKGTDLEDAMGMALKARQKQPNSTDIADTLGWIYIKKNLSEDAVRLFKDLVVKEPTNPLYHYHYGMALLEKGDKPSAKRELQQALNGKTRPSKDQETKIRDLLATL